MGILAEALRDLAPQAPESAPDLPTVFGQGLRSAGSSAMGQLNTLAGAAGQAMGADDFAAGRLRAADQNAADAAAAAPRMQRFADVHSLRDAAEWGTGLAGGMVPVGGALAGAGLLTGGAAIPAMAAATGVMAPLEIGDVLQRQREQGQPMSLREAVPVGLGSAALQAVVPGMGVAKLAGKAARGSVLHEALHPLLAQPAAVSGAEALKEVGSGQELDPSRIGEAAASGLAMALPFSAAGAAGAALRGRGGAKPAPGAPNEPPAGAPVPPEGRSPAGGPDSPPPGPSQRVADSLSALFDKGKAAARGAVDRVSQGLPAGDIGEIARGLADNGGAAVGDVLAKADGDTAQQVTTWAKQLADDPSLPPDRREQLNAAMQDPADQGNQRVIAGLKQAQDTAQDVSSSVSRLHDAVSKWYAGKDVQGTVDAAKGLVGKGLDAAKGVAVKGIDAASGAIDRMRGGDVQKSEDFEGVRRVIGEQVVPALQEVNPAVLDDPRNVGKIADSLRMFIEQVATRKPGKLDSDTVVHLIDIFGDRTTQVLDSVHNAVMGDDRAGAENFFGALNQIRDIQDRGTKLADVLSQNLKPEFQESYTAPQIREFARHLQDWAQRTPDGSEASRFHDRRVADVLDKHFDKPDTVMSMVEKSAKADKATFAKDAIETDEHGQPVHADGVDYTDVLSESGPKQARVSDKLVSSPEGHRAEFGNEGQAERMIREAQARDGGLSAKWVPAADWHAENGGEAPAHSEGRGYVVAERMPGSDKLTAKEASGFKFDSSKGDRANNKSVIDAGEGVKLDAMKLGRQRSGEELPWNAADDKSSMVRLSRQFMNNVAAVQEHLGRSFDVPPDTVVAVRGKTQITAGKLMSLKQATETRTGLHDEAPRERSDRLKNEMSQIKDLSGLVDKLRDAKDPKERAALKAEIKALRSEAGLDKVDVNDHEQLLDEYRDRRVQVAQMEAAERVQHEIEQRGMTELPHDANIHELAALGKVEPIRQSMDGTPISHAPRKSPRELLAQRAAKAESGIRAAADAALKDAANRPGGLETDHVGFSHGGQDYVARQVRPGRVEVQDSEGNVLYGASKESPSPKAVAAKKAAFLEKARSGDADLIKTLSASDDAKGLQRAAKALADEKMTPEIRKVTDAINARLGELVRDNPDLAYGMQLSHERIDPAVTSANGVRQAVKQHIEQVLGPAVRTVFARIMHAGEFERVGTQDTIRVSVHALNPMSTAYHESLHAWFRQLADKGLFAVMRPLHRAADSAIVRRRLEQLLANQPEALRQLSDAEERVAYMYQFWSTRDASGRRMLELGPETQTVFGRVAQFFRQVTGIWSNDQRAEHIMEYFHSGEYQRDSSAPSAVAAATLEVGRNVALSKAKAMTEPLARLADELGVAGAQRLRDTEVPALRELANLIKATGRERGDGDHGFVPAARIERTRVMNQLGEGLRQYSSGVLDEALRHLQLGTQAPTPEAGLVQGIVKRTLRDSLDYMRAAGVHVGDLGHDYFPRVWDGSYISRHQPEFLAMVERYVASGQYSGDPRELMHKLVSADGNEFQIETMKPGMQHVKERLLSFIAHADAEPFLRKDLYGTMQSYITQATRRAEWARRFGDNGAKVRDLLQQAQRQGAERADIAAAERFVRGVDGTLGDNLNPTARRLFGDMIVYQNIRLLPLAIFSSVVDPLGIMVRGGTMGDAWSTFKRGIKETAKNFQRDPSRDASTEMAETLGIVDSTVLQHTLGSLYSQGMVGNTGRKVNDTFFRLNLMEQFNTSMRVGAMEAGMRFLLKHADGTASQHSARWISELGLEQGDIQRNANGTMKTSVADGLTADQAGKVRAALNEWVDGAVLRPDAADKPIWMNDPHWALVAHLKQFVYSFHETIMKRVMHEYQNGNYRPAMALASYVPVMIASDLVKGMIQGGGSQPSWKDKWGVEDYLWSGVQRGGLLGTGQFAADMLGDIKNGGVGVGALAGPTIEQLTDAVRVLEGREQFGHFALKSMPANALYASLAGGEAPDPKFVD